MRYRRWSRITTNDFLNDRRKRKSLGRSGGMLPRKIFRIWTPYTPFSLVSESFRQDIGQLHSPRADESLQIGWLLHQSQFPYCSGYEARRVQTIFHFQDCTSALTFVHPKVVQECNWIENSVIKMLMNNVCTLTFVCCRYWLSRWC